MARQYSNTLLSRPEREQSEPTILTRRDASEVRVESGPDGRPALRIPGIPRPIDEETLMNMNSAEQNRVLEARYGSVRDREEQLAALLNELRAA